MIQRIRSGWNSIRILYLLAGLAITVQAIWTAEWFVLLPGLYFMAMGIFAFGCASGNCALPQHGMTEKAGKEK